MSRTPLVAGNWKMNKTVPESLVLVAEIGAGLPRLDAVEVALLPPFTSLWPVSTSGISDSGVVLGAQDLYWETSGAFTGEISAEMLADCGVSTVIVGHSERRSYFAETDGDVKLKAQAALRAGLMPIICVGETNSDREAGRTLAVIKRQLVGSVPDDASPHQIVIAYEPIWAIGTGLTPTLADIAEVHGCISRELASILSDRRGATRILYGGSVKPANAHDILAVAHVAGALVGGASLKAADFLAIANGALDLR